MKRSVGPFVAGAICGALLALAVTMIGRLATQGRSAISPATMNACGSAIQVAIGDEGPITTDRIKALCNKFGSQESVPFRVVDDPDPDDTVIGSILVLKDAVDPVIIQSWSSGAAIRVTAGPSKVLEKGEVRSLLTAVHDRLWLVR